MGCRDLDVTVLVDVADLLNGSEGLRGEGDTDEVEDFVELRRRELLCPLHRPRLDTSARGCTGRETGREEGDEGGWDGWGGVGSRRGRKGGGGM